mgnify:CR=1 FL=1
MGSKKSWNMQSDERKEICFSIRVPSELGNEWALRKSGVKWIFSVEGEDLPQEEGPSICTARQKQVCAIRQQRSPLELP